MPPKRGIVGGAESLRLEKRHTHVPFWQLTESKSTAARVLARPQRKSISVGRASRSPSSVPRWNIVS